MVVGSVVERSTGGKISVNLYFQLKELASPHLIHNQSEIKTTFNSLISAIHSLTKLFNFPRTASLKGDSRCFSHNSVHSSEYTARHKQHKCVSIETNAEK